MKNLKIFLVILVGICTLLGVMYLIAIARDMEKYTMSNYDNGKEVIVFSSSSSQFKEVPEKNKLMEYCKNMLEEAGSRCSYIDMDDMDEKAARKALYDASKGGRCILIDMVSTKLVVSSSSVILRVSKMDEKHYEDNLKYAKEICADLESSGLKVHMLIDGDKDYYQSYGWRAVRVEIYDSSSEQDIKKVLSAVFASVIK